MKSVLVAMLCAVGLCLFSAVDARASCTAGVNCSVTVIDCSGQSICQSGPDWVQCDDQERIYCPVCQAQTTCCDGRFIYCNGYSSCDTIPGQMVICDGQPGGICPDCPNYLSALPGIFAEQAATANPAEPKKECAR